jgi:hypothetical protein
LRFEAGGFELYILDFIVKCRSCEEYEESRDAGRGNEV